MLSKEVKNKSLNNCVICHSSSLTEKLALEEEGEYPVYGASGIFTNSQTYMTDEDTILIIKDGSNVGKLQYATGKHSVIGTLNYFTPQKNISLKYIYYCLFTFNFDLYKVGSGIPHIYFKDYGNEYIYCPNFETQKRIADALSAIDNKISIETAVLAYYLKQKAYLLQSLFI